MFIEALFVIAKHWKWSLCPGEWLNKLVHTQYGILLKLGNNLGISQKLSYPTIWMTLNRKKSHLGNSIYITLL